MWTSQRFQYPSKLSYGQIEHEIHDAVPAAAIKYIPSASWAIYRYLTLCHWLWRTYSEPGRLIEYYLVHRDIYYFCPHIKVVLTTSPSIIFWQARRPHSHSKLWYDPMEHEKYGRVPAAVIKYIPSASCRMYTLQTIRIRMRLCEVCIVKYQ